MARPRHTPDAHILEAARHCFLADGPGVSTTIIAERAGVSQATLFKRFGTKEDLMLAALLPKPEQAWVEQLHQGPDDRPIRDQLVEHALRIAAFFENMIPCMSVLRSAGFDHIALVRQLGRHEEPPPVRARRALVGWIERATDRGQLAPVDAEAATTALLGALQHRIFIRHVVGAGSAPAPTPESIEALVHLLYHGMAPEEDA